jgi:hypothetical protein
MLPTKTKLSSKIHPSSTDSPLPSTSVIESQLPLYRGVDCSSNCYNNRVSPYQLLATIDTSPEDRSIWFKNMSGQSKTQNDQVRENVINGLWLCNFEPAQQENYSLCRRNFFLEPNTSVPPFQRGQQVDNESYLRPAISKNECWSCRR